MRRLLVLFVALVMALAMVGVTTASAVGTPDVVVVFEEGGLDNPFNAIINDGLDDAEATLGFEIHRWLSATNDGIGADADALAASGEWDLIVGAGFLVAAEMEGAVAAYPDQLFTIVDAGYETAYSNVSTVFFSTHEPAFMAGYAAAGMSVTGAVGVYGGLQIQPVTVFMDGYALGVEYYNATHGTNVEVLGWDPHAQEGFFINTFSSSRLGRWATMQLFRDGADAVFSVAGALPALGTVEAAEFFEGRGNDVRVILPDVDWFEIVGDPGEVLLTSVIKNFGVGVLHQIEALMDGTWAAGIVLEDLASGGVAMAPYHALADDVPRDLQREVLRVQRGIIRGMIPTLP